MSNEALRQALDAKEWQTVHALYKRAGLAKRSEGLVCEAAFLLTQACVYALEAGDHTSFETCWLLLAKEGYAAYRVHDTQS